MSTIPEPDDEEGRWPSGWWIMPVLLLEAIVLPPVVAILLAVTP